MEGLNLPKRSRIFLDYDDMSFFQVLEDVDRLMDKYGLEGPTDIYNSSGDHLYDCTFWECGIVRFGSWHAQILETKKWSQVERILEDSNAHKGFKYFSKKMKDITLRISKKGTEGKVPEKVCTINRGGG